MSTNPFYKYLTKEDKLQHSIISYLQYQHPKILFTHVPNEGKRSKFERYKFKYLGAKAGVPDILIFYANNKHNGLAIELKVGYNKPTAHQKEWLEKLKQCGWSTYCINDYDMCIDIINSYIKNEI